MSSIVEDGVTGLIVSADDLDDLIEATARLVEDHELRTQMGRAARRRGLDRFSLDAVGSAWMDLLQPLLDRAAAAAAARLPRRYRQAPGRERRRDRSPAVARSY